MHDPTTGFVAPWGKYSCKHYIEREREIMLLQKKLLSKSSLILGEFHKKTHDSRYWEIIVGHWIARFSCLVSNYYYQLKFCIDRYNVTHYTIVSSPDSYSPAFDSKQFYANQYDSQWCHLLYSDILLSLNCNSIKINHKNIHHIDHNSCSIKNSFAKIQHPRKKREALKRLASSLNRQSSIFTYNTYLKPIPNFLLNLYLYQIPYPTLDYDIAKQSVETKIDSNMRDILTRSAIKDTESDLEHILCTLIFKHIPCAYLENLNDFESISESMPWPKKTPLIFTSNSFDADEIFKIWTANRTLKGAKYIIGQHGAQYGTSSVLSHNPTVEERIADIFITWGWKLPQSNTHPICNLKSIYTRTNTKSINSKKCQLLLVQDGAGYPYSRAEDVAHLFSINLAAQFKLVDHLHSKILSNTTVRLQRDPGPVKARIAKLWNDRYADSLKIDLAQKSFEHTYKKLALSVFCYDSTGFLENILTNNPSILFIPDSNLRIKDHFLPHYQKLINAGLLQRDPIKAAEFIERIWDNTIHWWNSTEIKEARNDFAFIFSRNITNPIKTLKSELVDFAYRESKYSKL